MGVYENINGSQIPIASNLRFRNVPIEGLVTEEELLQGLATKNDVFQYETMPTASADLVSKVVQYVGETTANYTNGYFYECVSDGAVTPSYSWVEKSVQEGGNGEDIRVSALPTPSADFLNQTYLLTSPQTGYTEGGIYKCVAKGTNPESYEWKMINATDPNTVLVPKIINQGTYEQPYYSEHVIITPQQDGSVDIETDGQVWAGAIFKISVSPIALSKITFKITEITGYSLPDYFSFSLKGRNGWLVFDGVRGYDNNNEIHYILSPSTLKEYGIDSSTVEVTLLYNLATKYNLKVTCEYGFNEDIYNSLYFPLADKKVIFLGDSITALQGVRSWVDKFVALTGCTKVVNVAVPSAVLYDYDDTVYDGNPSQSQQHNNTLGNQVQKIINNNYDTPDLIIIAIGINAGITADSTRISACYNAINSGGTWNLPNIDDLDKTHSEGAFRYCNEKLHSLYPNAVICWCNPIQRFVDASSPNSIALINGYADALKTLTMYGAVNNIETNRCGIMTSANAISGVNGEDLVDGLHPNENGAMKMAKYNAAAISKLFI